MPNKASMGFVGFVRFTGLQYAPAAIVRATSADIKATQNIDSPNLVDGKNDKTTYQLGPIEVGGSVAFPAVHEDGSTVTTALWKQVIQRNNTGKLMSSFDIDIKYTNDTSYAYKGCIVDTFEFSVAQSDTVNINVGIIGTSRDDNDLSNTNPSYGLRNTRVVTWNDAFISLSGGVTVTGDEIRSFTNTVNNNSQRYYTMNSQLYPADISATKRDITGNLVVMGRNVSLSTRAFSNQQRCTEISTLTFGYKIGGQTTGGCSGDFVVQFPNSVVFQIEEIAITNELLETTINYRVLPGISYNGSGNGVNFLLS
jgi:hypothetical protein